MPIFANNVVVVSQETPQPTSDVVESSSNYVASFPDLDPNHTHIVVNGQAKKIGKTSQYLLDMLSSDK
jgi:hypothetical protein